MKDKDRRTVGWQKEHLKQHKEARKTEVKCCKCNNNSTVAKREGNAWFYYCEEHR